MEKDKLFFIDCLPFPPLENQRKVGENMENIENTENTENMKNTESTTNTEWQLDLTGEFPLHEINALSFDQLKDIAARAQQTAEEANQLAAEKEAAAKEAEKAAQIAQLASADADQAKQSALEITSKAELLLNKLKEEEAKELAQKAAALAHEKKEKLAQIEQELADITEKLAVAKKEAEEAQLQAKEANQTQAAFQQKAQDAQELARQEVIAAETAYAVAVSTSSLAEEAQKKADTLQQVYQDNKKQQAELSTEIEKWLAKEENAYTTITKAQKTQEELTKMITEKQFFPTDKEREEEREDNFASITKEDIPIFKKKKSHPILSFCVFLILIIGAALGIKTFVFQIANISGESMYPTLHDADKVLVSMISYHLGAPQREDIVIISAPERFGDKYIKRVIALPGEHIVIKNNQVFVNDQLLEEEYLTNTYTNGNIDTIVPADSYFVMGDNRTKSSDSRSGSIGFIKREEIAGKAIFVLLPKDNWKKLD